MSAVSTKSNNIKSAVSENVKNFSSYRTHTRKIGDTSLTVGTKPTGVAAPIPLSQTAAGPLSKSVSLEGDMGSAH